MSLRSLWNALVMGGLAAAWSGPAPAANVHAEESVKAAFALRFAGYVEWPDDAMPGSAFTIVVLGASDIARQMQTLAHGRRISDRPVLVRRIARIEDAAGAQMLYIGTDRRSSLRDLLARLAGRSLLVVSDEEHALESGSTINLRVADQHVHFEVSLPAARLARLQISSELLALAVRVQK